MIPVQNTPNSASPATSGTVATARHGGASTGLSASGAAATGAGSQAVTEQVSISTTGRMMNLASMQGATPPASDARIAGLQAAVQSGQYVADPQRIARGLLQDSQALLGASKPAGN